MFPVQRYLQRKMRFILPVAVSGCFVESRVALQWEKMLSLLLPTTDNSIFSEKKNAAKCLSTTRKKRIFSAWSPVLAVSETFFLFFFFSFFFFPQHDWDSSWHLRNVGAKNPKFSELFLNTGWVSIALLAWVWTLTSASPHSKAVWGWFEPKWIQQGV